MGLRFPNPVGLAAGLDKNGDHIDSLGALGFGFMEVGTVTPRPQAGNPRPRLFRLPAASALIHRMGFNNKGVAHLVGRAQKRRYAGVLGVNIGKNAGTPLADAVQDYLHCLRAAHPVADYIAVNLSSPNTPDLRRLQFGEALQRLLAALKAEILRLDAAAGRGVPLVIKIAPDLSDEEVRAVAGALSEAGVDGVIATNTTVDKSAVNGLPHGDEEGGLSGAPLEEKANHVLRLLASSLPLDIPVIGVGGIHDPDSALRKLALGASLVQLYSGFVYQGPPLVRTVVRAAAAETDKVVTGREGRGG